MLQKYEVETTLSSAQSSIKHKMRVNESNIKWDLIYWCLFFPPSFDQNHKPENLLPSVGSDQPKVSQQIQPDVSSHEPTCTEVGGQNSDESKSGREGDGQFLSPSQKDVQTLQDLVELAREGLTLTQWNLDVDHVQAAEQPGEFWQLCEPCPQSLRLHRARLLLCWVRRAVTAPTGCCCWSKRWYCGGTFVCSQL